MSSGSIAVKKEQHFFVFFQNVRTIQKDCHSAEKSARKQSEKTPLHRHIHTHAYTHTHMHSTHTHIHTHMCACTHTNTQHTLQTTILVQDQLCHVDWTSVWLNYDMSRTAAGVSSDSLTCTAKTALFGHLGRRFFSTGC